MYFSAHSLAALLLGAFPLVLAHPHHETPSEAASIAPLDTILWIHILLQVAVWGILFPIGMVLGITRSRWHVPLQSAGYLLTLGGYVLGRSHGGRQFPPGAHGTLAYPLLIPIFLQLLLGIYLKLHIHEKTLRPWAVRVHGFVGKCYPIIGWVQMLFGAITLGDYCRGGHLGQCLAHYIMGSGFIAYGAIIAIIFLVGENWVRRTGRSPDFFDSCVITAWGIVNTFTEHRGTVWHVKDMQHTMMGVIWWAGGLLGILLSRNNQRSVVPSLILILTGWAMSGHAQALEISTMVHGMFGKTLMMAGLARIIEVVYFAPRYDPLPSSDTGRVALGDDNSSEHTIAEGRPPTPQAYDDKPRRVAGSDAFRHLPPFLLVASGVCFMSATDEELEFVHGLGMDHVTYLLIMFSLAFLIYALMVFSLHLYSTTGKHAPSASDASDNAGGYEMAPTTATSSNKWYARVPGAEQGSSRPMHVLGDDEDEEEHEAEDSTTRLYSRT